MIPLNIQPPEGLDRWEDGSLDIFHCWETIQGEGPLVGAPSVFIRLAGCNWDCPLCDTDYTSKRERLSPWQLMERVTSLRKDGLVVLTGGEPFRQDFTRLAELLLQGGYGVQVETNGTLYHPIPPGTIIVCSPKAPKINDQLRPFVNALKYVLDADSIAEDGLPTSVLGKECLVARPWPSFPKSQVYVQPIDVGDEQENKRHMTKAVEVSLKHGYRLCIQTHKLLGLE